MKTGKIVYQNTLPSGKQIIIRYPVESDAKAMTDYMNTLSKEQTFISFQGEILELKDEENYLKSYLEKIEKGTGVKLMVFVNDNLVGISDIESKTRVEKHVGVFGITLAKEYRGQGVGKVLMEQVLDESKKNLKDLKIVTLSVFANNPSAVNLYKKMGFTEYGNLPKGIIHKGEYIDHIYMYKHLD